MNITTTRNFASINSAFSVEREEHTGFIEPERTVHEKT